MMTLNPRDHFDYALKKKNCRAECKNSGEHTGPTKVSKREPNEGKYRRTVGNDKANTDK